MKDGFIFNSEKTVTIKYFVSEKNAVVRALNNLKKDIIGVFGCVVNLEPLPANELMCIQTDDNVSDIFVSTSDIFKCIDADDVLNRWEGYAISVEDGKLFICGADIRGTIFGIYELSRYIGVSAWHYFADVPYKKKVDMVIPDGFICKDYPSVQYRGIFLNDEEELDNWAKKHTSDGTIGPETYEKIYELLLRLKGNYIWPAMHVNYFQENPENARLADDMGIVVGTSHCDMLMRSNQNEWNPWLKSKGYRSDYKAVHSDRIDNSQDESNKEVIFYDYSIPGHNREVINEYWRESVDLNKNYEVCYTIGMRGVHDYGFSTIEIDNNNTLSQDEKFGKKIELLENVMNVQRSMIGDNALQSFIPYKEVLDLYNKGLKVPDDVTLIWVDDNFGYMRRYPNAEERKRSGGHGLYYHVSYWAAPDMSYLFLNSIPMAQIFNELKKSYFSGIQKMWVLNVGALKPLEMETEAFINYGWNVGKPGALMESAHEYTVKWFNSIFSGDNGEELAILYERFCQLTNARKIEHMVSNVFSQSGYGDEAGERVCELEDIFKRSNEIYMELPNNEKDSFFQLFLFKIQASYYHNCSYYYADRSAIMLDRGNNTAADLYTFYSSKLMGYLRNLIRYYNKVLCNGKWDEIMTPDSFPPPGINFYPVCKPSIRRSMKGMNVVLWDGTAISEQAKIGFSLKGNHTKWFDIGNMGIQAIHFKIKCHADWIHISETEGLVETEKRVYLTVSDISEIIGSEAILRISDIESGQTFCIRLVADSVESCKADGAICLYADQYVLNDQDEYGAGWEPVCDLGRGYGNAMMAVNTFGSSGKAYLEYSFYINDPGIFEMVITRYLTLEANGHVRYGISVDNGSMIILQSDSYDEWHGKWKDCVLNNGEKMSVMLPFLETGMHFLRIYMIDDFVTISKMVIYTEKRRETFFEYSGLHYTRDYPKVNWNMLDKLQKELYRSNDEVIPETVYADSRFWDYNRIYMKNDICINAARGKRTYSEYYDEKKGNSILEYFPKGIFDDREGAIRIEAEYALLNDENAYLSLASDGSSWEYVHAPSDGGTGFAMISPGHELSWDIIDNKVNDAPGMHFKISVDIRAIYKVWLLVYYEDHMSDRCYVAVDGTVQSPEYQICRGRMFNYSTAHIYFWCQLTYIPLSMGIHTISIYAGKSGLQIDRIYITRGDELPPTDDKW